MIALFLAGGKGTRLWPLSRENNPKQLQALVGKKSLMTQTIERIAPLVEPRNVWIVTGEKCAEQIGSSLPSVPQKQIIIEPFPLGTNLAVGLGAMKIAREKPDAVILVGWADAHIGNEAEFRHALEKAEKLAAKTNGVILGASPTYPATGYGYIEMGEPIFERGGGYQISRFEEKPLPERAEEFIRRGNYLWNTGISVWKVSELLKLMRRYRRDHYDALQYVAAAIDAADEAARMKKAFADLEPISIDKAIFEKADCLATIPADLEWSDIGTWSAIYDVQARAEENVTKGSVIMLDTNKCLIYAGKRLVATLGVSDLVIVETEDAVLVAHRSECSRLKELHAQIKTLGRIEYL